jgi:hypothetical protein
MSDDSKYTENQSYNPGIFFGAEGSFIIFLISPNAVLNSKIIKLFCEILKFLSIIV